jgi:hypothetical protein
MCVPLMGHPLGNFRCAGLAHARGPQSWRTGFGVPGLIPRVGWGCSCALGSLMRMSGTHVECVDSRTAACGTPECLLVSVGALSVRGARRGSKEL